MKFSFYPNSFDLNLTFFQAQNYEVVFEKAELLGYNKDYGTLGTFNFRKINRTAFALNCTFTASRDVDLNDARVSIIC